MLNITPQRVILMAILLLGSLSLVKSEELKNESPDTKRLFDFKLTSDMKTSDLDDPKSALSKLITFIVKGPSKASEYISVITKSVSPPEVKIAIKDNSIFHPGDTKDETKIQYGFRRTDLVPAIDKNTVLQGISTFYATIRFDPDAPLNISHGYLLSSIEAPSGDSFYSIFAGSSFASENVEAKPTSDAQTIRVRDFKYQTIFSAPLNMNTSYNFAVTVDWKQNTLTIYHSTNQEPLKKVYGPMANDPSAKNPDFDRKGEFHIQVVKHPVPNPKDPPEKRGDVPHLGLQPKIKKEHVFFSNVYVTEGTEIQQPKFGTGKHKIKTCKRVRV